MNSQEEEMEITIKETEELEEQKVYDYELTTGEGMEVSITMPELKGKRLDAIIIRPNAQIDVLFSINQEMIIYEKLGMKEFRYIPIRYTSRDSRDEIFNFAPQKIYLYDTPTLRIAGNKYSGAQISILLCE